MNACVEGFATFIERRVAEELGAQRIEDRVNDVRIRYRVEDDRFPGWILGPVIESADHIYHSGADFLSWQFENGGMEGVWTATSCLPSQTRVLFHPEMYSATPAKTPDYRKAMLSLNGKFGKDWSEVVNTSAGEMVLRCALSSLPKEDVNLAVDGIEHVQMLVVAANKRRSGSVIAYIAKDRDSIDALADAIKTLETEGMKRAGFRGKTLGSRKFEGIDGAESAQKTSYQVRDVWKQTPCTRITVKKDRVLLVISVSGTQISDATTKSIANQVLLRLGRLGVFDV
jgi:hypothetical protein